jgi:hypothetical protein
MKLTSLCGQDDSAAPLLDEVCADMFFKISNMARNDSMTDPKLITRGSNASCPAYGFERPERDKGRHAFVHVNRHLPQMSDQ